jgi:hypothetical protein
MAALAFAGPQSARFGVNEAEQIRTKAVSMRTRMHNAYQRPHAVPPALNCVGGDVDREIRTIFLITLRLGQRMVCTGCCIVGRPPELEEQP